MSDRTKSLEHRRKAQQLFPGVTQLLSKRPEMFSPGQWPGYFSKASGAETWDLDGNRYLDMSIFGIGANILGFCDPDVDAAVHAVIDGGNSCSLNPPEDVPLAELLCDLHPWAQRVRYCRGGGEAMAIAVRIARAASGREVVAFCGYHGWHDWYLAANLGTDEALTGHLLPGLNPAGVPRSLAGTALPFRYNHFDDLEKIAAEQGDRLGVIVMEPIRDAQPHDGFLQQVRDLADRIGAVLVFDEITVGFRLTDGGAHLLLRVEPDIAVFAKAMSNGYPMAAIIGREQVMEAAQSTFISSTYWTERIGPAAALATITKLGRLKVHEHLGRIGASVQRGWMEAARVAGLELHVGGLDPLSHMAFEGEEGPLLLTLYTQFMLERGYLAGGRFYASYAHSQEMVGKYLQATGEVFCELAELKRRGDLEFRLDGEIAHTGFRRLN